MTRESVELAESSQPGIPVLLSSQGKNELTESSSEGGGRGREEREEKGIQPEAICTARLHHYVSTTSLELF